MRGELQEWMDCPSGRESTVKRGRLTDDRRTYLKMAKIHSTTHPLLPSGGSLQLLYAANSSCTNKNVPRRCHVDEESKTEARRHKRRKIMTGTGKFGDVLISARSSPDEAATLFTSFVLCVVCVIASTCHRLIYIYMYISRYLMRVVEMLCDQTGETGSRKSEICVFQV